MKQSYKGSVGYGTESGWNKDDSVSMSSSSNLTYTITNAPVTNSYSYPITNYTVSGTIKTESESSQNYTLKDAGDYSGSSKDVQKVALALSISDGTKGAKFVISVSDGGNSSRKMTGEYNYSDLQVYDKDNKLLFTIPGEEYSYPLKSFVGDNHY